jgi:hypothetical protein
MAHFIAVNLAEGKKFIHYNGAYHSDNYQGIVHYLRLDRPDVRVATITTVLQDDISNLSEENKGGADFIVAVPEAMTRTY